MFKFSISADDAAIINNAIYEAVVASNGMMKCEAVAHTGITEWSFDQTGWVLEIMDEVGTDYADAIANVLDDAILRHHSGNHKVNDIIGLSV